MSNKTSRSVFVLCRSRGRAVGCGGSPTRRPHLSARNCVFCSSHKRYTVRGNNGTLGSRPLSTAGGNVGVRTHEEHFHRLYIQATIFNRHPRQRWSVPRIVQWACGPAGEKAPLPAHRPLEFAAFRSPLLPIERK